MKIKLGTLRKIIREELNRAGIKELNIRMNEPAFQGGSGYITGWQPTTLSQLSQAYEEGPHNLEDVKSMFKDAQLKLDLGKIDPTVVPSLRPLEFYFVTKQGGNVTLVGKNKDGFDVVAVNQKNPSSYTVDSLEISPDAAEWRGRLGGAN